MAADGNISFLPTAREIVSPAARPFFDAELRREQVRLSRNEATGVCWSGMGSDPAKPRTVGEMVLAAEEAQQKAEAFANSPRGRFLAALKGVADLPTHEADAERLRGIFCRELANPSLPVNGAAVGAALAILNSIPGRDARAAIDALAELLMGADRRAA